MIEPYGKDKDDDGVDHYEILLQGKSCMQRDIKIDENWHCYISVVPRQNGNGGTIIFIPNVYPDQLLKGEKK